MKTLFHDFEQMRPTPLADAPHAPEMRGQMRPKQLLDPVLDAPHATEMVFSDAPHANVYKYSHRHECLPSTFSSQLRKPINGQEGIEYALVKARHSKRRGGKHGVCDCSTGTGRAFGKESNQVIKHETRHFRTSSDFINLLRIVVMLPALPTSLVLFSDQSRLN
jgi:hypothetical protein